MYDIIIIGAGPGGYVAAERAGKAGKKVLIIEKSALGGVCLNHGCIPTKSLLHVAKSYKNILESKNVGITVGSPSLDMNKAMDWKEKIITTQQKGIAFLMKKYKVDVVFGEASIIGTNSVSVNNESYSAKNIIIATGSRPVVPPIPGVDQDNVVTNREALTLREIPERIAVIGGGVIGMEFASFYSTLGKTVDVFEMLPEILPIMDKDQAVTLRKSMKSVNFHLSTKVEKIEGNSVFYHENGSSQVSEADLVLLAVGRRPNTEGLELERLKVDFTPKGIVVDDQMRTNIPGVYAIGDVTGRGNLAHAASRMGEVAINTILEKTDRMRFDSVPWAIYTLPEASGCGLTEEQAKEQGFEIEVASYTYQANGRNLSENGFKQGSSKVISDKKTGRILGVHLLGSYASENIFGAALIQETDMRAQELREVVFPHPSVSEVIREAAFELS